MLPGLLLLLVLDDMPFDMEGTMETSHSLVFRGFVKFSAESGFVSQKGPHGEEGAHHPRVSPLCLAMYHSQWASTGMFLLHSACGIAKPFIKFGAAFRTLTSFRNEWFQLEALDQLSIHC